MSVCGLIHVERGRDGSKVRQQDFSSSLFIFIFIFIFCDLIISIQAPNL
ncbi:MAG: hypothetical protein MCS20_01660 [Candidatus Phytoplasma mali]|nr:hypothetical protein [Candidatus Phytoplasma mali]